MRVFVLTVNVNGAPAVLAVTDSQATGKDLALEWHTARHGKRIDWTKAKRGTYCTGVTEFNLDCFFTLEEAEVNTLIPE